MLGNFRNYFQRKFAQLTARRVENRGRYQNSNGRVFQGAFDPRLIRITETSDGNAFPKLTGRHGTAAGQTVRTL